MTVLGPPCAAATALRSLTAIVLDTETTSLDTGKGRIIELAAVPIVEGKIAAGQAFSTLIDPGEPIPEKSRAVHGITGGMLAGAESFAAAAKRWRDFAGGHLLLGYSIAFDLAMLKREHELAGLAWSPPRAICVQELVRVLKPTLPDEGLETVAGWLGIKVEGRHRALADAKLAAEVFLALLPKLREKSIRTVGEATRACRKQGDTQEIAAIATFARVDSYPYRHRVEDIMSKPPRLIDGTATLKLALQEMEEARVSSLFVAPQGRGAHGIVTERDLLRAIAQEDAKAFNIRVGRIASFPLETVRARDFVYVALGLMRRRRFRHLGVVADDDQLVGALSQRDLLRLRADHALALTGALDDAADIPALATVWRQLAGAARALLVEGVAARDIAAIISREVCALTARAAQMAEREVPQRPADLTYAVMVLGSGGRGESLLALDQDNAIVFDTPHEEAAQLWLKPFATRMNAILDEIGVPLCKGGVMAGNKAWRLTSAGWRRRVANWLIESSAQNLMNADIFFDAVPVHGDATLADNLRSDAVAAASKSLSFIKLLSLEAARAEPPLGWFGRLATDETGRVDLKMHGIMPIFTAARAGALRHGLLERSTKARLEALRGKPEIAERAIDTLVEAHGVILQAILAQQLDDIETGISPSNRVDPARLSAVEKDLLKWALKQPPTVRDILGDPIG